MKITSLIFSLILTSTPLTLSQNIYINEIDPDQTGADDAEFIELYDGGLGNTSLDGMVVVLYNGYNNTSYASYSLNGHKTNEEGFFTIGKEGMVNTNIHLLSTGLQNGPDAVALYFGVKKDFPNKTPLTTNNLIDAIVYNKDEKKASDILLSLLKNGEHQLNESKNGTQQTHSLQRYPDGAGGARITSGFITAVPTPGYSNTNSTTAIPVNINSSIQVYPNPFDQELMLISNKAVKSVTLHNSLGQTIYHIKENQLSYHISTNYLPKGLYMIQVKYLDGTIHFKKVVKR
ncbi:T9SS C-terminal target domain-containing protein [Marinilabiliaceae bacterium JC017]|nr:T9SS C-terminal target domain-containing protein [Marinilabiliaceae bacterium JC017]